MTLRPCFETIEQVIEALTPHPVQEDLEFSRRIHDLKSEIAHIIEHVKIYIMQNYEKVDFNKKKGFIFGGKASCHFGEMPKFLKTKYDIEIIDITKIKFTYDPTDSDISIDVQYNKGTKNTLILFIDDESCVSIAEFIKEQLLNQS